MKNKPLFCIIIMQIALTGFLTYLIYTTPKITQLTSTSHVYIIATVVLGWVGIIAMSIQLCVEQERIEIGKWLTYQYSEDFLYYKNDLYIHIGAYTIFLQWNRTFIQSNKCCCPRVKLSIDKWKKSVFGIKHWRRIL